MIRFVKGGLFSVTNMLLGIILTKVLFFFGGEATVADYASVFSIVVVVSAISMLGLNDAIVRLLANSDVANISTLTPGFLAIYLPVAALLLGLGSYFLDSFQVAEGSYILLFVSVVAWTMIKIRASAFQGNGMGYMAILSNGGIYSCSFLVVFLSDYLLQTKVDTPSLIVIGLLCAFLVTEGANVYLLRHVRSLRIPLTTIYDAAKLIPTVFSNLITDRWLPIFLLTQWNISTAIPAYFLAFQITNMLALPIRVSNRLDSRSLSENNRNLEIEKNAMANFAKYSPISIVAFIFISVFSTQIISLFTAPTTDHVQILLLLATSQLISVLGGQFGLVLTLLGYFKMRNTLSIFSFMTFFGIVLLVKHVSPMLSVAIALCISQTLTVTLAIYFQRVAGVRAPLLVLIFGHARAK